MEAFIPGKEIRDAMMGNKAIGAIELKPKRNFMTIRLNIRNHQKLSILCQQIFT